MRVRRSNALVDSGKAIQQGSDDASRHIVLGMVLAGLGEKDAAIAEGKRACHAASRISGRIGWAKDDAHAGTNLRLDGRKRRGSRAS
jgi:hypothetical protein